MSVENTENNAMINPLAILKSKIAPFFLGFRHFLEHIREKNTNLFDFFSEAVKFALTFFGCFTPAWITSVAGLMVGNLLLFSSLLTLQWATLTNKADRKVAELEKKYKDDIDVLDEIYVDDNHEKLRTHKKELMNMEHFTFSVVNFSHLISDKVKKLSTEIALPIDNIDGSMRNRVSTFLQESINSIEDILSQHYDVEMRASIKLTYDEKSFRTYVRGGRNIESRGGELKVKRLNKARLLIADNYAYDAIANKYLNFFAEGNLRHMHNKAEENDEFFCEYKNYLDIFCATFIMPIRIQEYQDDADKYEIFGIICIDCNAEISEWSQIDFKDKLCYHIVADYADNLAILFKIWSNKSEDSLQSIFREKFDRRNARRTKTRNTKNVNDVRTVNPQR